MTMLVNILFLLAIMTLGGLSIWQAIRGQFFDVLVTNAIVAGIIAIW